MFVTENLDSVMIEKWDMMIGHRPCTYLTVAANRHIPMNPERWKNQLDALIFFYDLWTSDIDKICLENPIGVTSTYIGKPTQIIHPYYFGDNVPKKTGLWIKGLPKLVHNPENSFFYQSTWVEPEYLEYASKSNKSGVSKYNIFGKLGKGHGKERSKTFPGIANAMADQWG